ncbi:MAG TPA: four helix bundle protein [Thermoanaerobaculia bacterium]|nr:four helix bundle protein [Thermoanaerobaculia bacterium]
MTHSSFRDIEAWQHARGLVRPVYEFTRRFPPEEQYVLTPQMRKAVHSVHSNIAEGRGRLSNAEWQQFLGQARGSLMELESDVIAAFDLEYATAEEVADLGIRIQRAAQVLNGLLRSTRRGFKQKKYKPPKTEPPTNPANVP